MTSIYTYYIMEEVFKDYVPRTGNALDKYHLTRYIMYSPNLQSTHYILASTQNFYLLSKITTTWY